MFERADEVVGRSVTADIAIDAGRVDIKRAVNVLFDFVVWVRHESAGLRRFHGLDKPEQEWNALKLIRVSSCDFTGSFLL